MEAHRCWNLPRNAGRLDGSLTAAVVNGISLNFHPPQSLHAHLLPRRRIPPSCWTVRWTGGTRPPVAGFLQVQVWLLNIAAPPLGERYQLALEGLLAAFHLPLPHAQTTAYGTLGAKKGGVRAQTPPSTCHQRDGTRADQPQPTRLLKAGPQVRHATEARELESLSQGHSMAQHHKTKASSAITHRSGVTAGKTKRGWRLMK